MDQPDPAQDETTLDIRESADRQSGHQPHVKREDYVPERARDHVRQTVTFGLLAIFAWVIVWATIESKSWPNHWNQTKEMLQIILPAITGLMGSVIGFYFGSSGKSAKRPL